MTNNIEIMLNTIDKLRKDLEIEEKSTNRWYNEAKRLKNIIKEVYDEIVKCDCKDCNGNHSHWLNPNLPKLEKLLKNSWKVKFR